MHTIILEYNRKWYSILVTTYVYCFQTTELQKCKYYKQQLTVLPIVSTSIIMHSENLNMQITTYTNLRAYTVPVESLERLPHLADNLQFASKTKIMS